jgi:outer membrane protein OmpA-like peptidoglycan-associated protein
MDAATAPQETIMSAHLLRFNRTSRALIMSAILASAACLSHSAMALDVPVVSTEHMAAGNQTTQIQTVQLQTVQLNVDNRTHKIEIDLQRARGFGVDNRTGKPELSDETKRALREMIRAQSLKGNDAGRVLVVGSNDDFSAPGRAGRTGFAAAKAIRDFMISEGVTDERIMVAGWQASRDDAGALATLGSGGRALVAPLASEQARRVISVHGDPGRALAFDSAFARLSLAQLSLARAGNATAAPIASAPAAKPLDIRPVVTQPAAPKSSVAAIAPAPVVAPSSITIRQSTIFPVALPEAGRPEAVQGYGALPLSKSPELTVQQTSNRCGAPSMILDDFYPGGPIVACGQRHPSERRRPVY